jgi:maltooligosyltrehalose trehalohydrolase
VDPDVVVDPPAGWVWAPFADRVDLVVDERREPLVAAHERDWWRPAPGAAALQPGTRYRFAVDGTVAPDPRSRWQPDGVDGPSEVVDHRAFGWHDHGFRPRPLADAVISELHIGTFTAAGTFLAAIDRFDHLAELGISHVELMPVHAFAGRHGWGYDGVAWFAPHAPYGSPDELKRLVDEAHGRGLAVLLDVVYNHLGPVGNHLAAFGPYLDERRTTPWGAAVNLDGPGSGPVRQMVVDAACGWLRDYHVDGLRLDAVHALVDRSAHHLLERLAGAVRALSDQLDRPVLLIAEDGTNDPRLLSAPAAGGYGLDAVWCDDVHHALHTAVTREARGYYADYEAACGFEVVERALSGGVVHADQHPRARRRAVGRARHGLRGDQLVACIQNHDQVGNRPGGERLGHLAGPAGQKVAAGLLLTAPFVPLLFQGEEWGASAPFPFFADHDDPDLAAAVREGRRGELAAIGWGPDELPEEVADPEDPATFAHAVLDWDELGLAEHAELLAWYRALLALRRSAPSLRDPSLTGLAIASDPGRRTLFVDRGDLRLLANLGTEPWSVPPATVLVSSRPLEQLEGRLVLPPTTFAAVTTVRSA